jgi:hypothetical protein
MIGAMTEQERSTLRDMFATRREYLLQRAAILGPTPTAQAWLELAERDAARIARLTAQDSAALP